MINVTRAVKHPHNAESDHQQTPVQTGALTETQFNYLWKKIMGASWPGALSGISLSGGRGPQICSLLEHSLHSLSQGAK